jgi:PKD repeat protein
MRTTILLLLLSLFSRMSASGQCNTGFIASMNISWVTVTASNSGPGVWHAWNFGDGTPLAYGNPFNNGATAMHEYNQPGTYVIKHIMGDSLRNCMDSSQQTVTAVFTYTCTADFRYMIDTPTGRYSFISTSFSSAPQTPWSPESYRWKSDGVDIGSGSNAYAVLSPGPHNVCLEMSLPGCFDSVCKVVTASPVPRCSTQAAFSYSAEPASPNRIRFSASPALPHAFYQWRTGDGGEYFGREFTHVYSGAGTYPVWLSVTDSVGRCTDTVLQHITVQPGPADSCVVSLAHQHHPVQNNEVSFTVNSSQPVRFMQWSIRFPDGTTDSLYRDQAYTFPDTGTYVVRLVVHTQTGCVRTVYDTVRVGSIGSANTVIPCYPNPATNTVTLQFRLEESLKMVISVYNTSGVEVKSRVEIGWKGGVVVSIPVNDLQPGQYFIHIVFPETYPVQRKSSIFQKL